MQQVLSGVMKALLSVFVNGAGHGDSSRGETPSVWVVGCREGWGVPGWGRWGPARSGPAGVWGCEARRGGDSCGAWRRWDRGSSPRAGGGPHLEGWGGPCPFLAAHNQASPLRAGPPGKRRGTGLKRLGLTHKQVVPARGQGCGPDRVSPGPTGPGPPVTHAESSQGSGSTVVRRLSHPGG